MDTYILLGEALIRRGAITHSQLRRALKCQSKTHARLGEVLVKLNYVTEEIVTECLADQFGYDVVDLTQWVPGEQCLNLVPFDFAYWHHVLPLSIEDDAFWCAVADPIDVNMTELISQMAKRPVHVKLAPKSIIDRFVLEHYQKLHPTIASEVRKSAVRSKRHIEANRESKDHKGTCIQPFDRQAVLSLCSQIPCNESKQGWIKKLVS